MVSVRRAHEGSVQQDGSQEISQDNGASQKLACKFCGNFYTIRGMKRHVNCKHGGELESLNKTVCSDVEVLYV